MSRWARAASRACAAMSSLAKSCCCRAKSRSACSSWARTSASCERAATSWAWDSASCALASVSSSRASTAPSSTRWPSSISTSVTFPVTLAETVAWRRAVTYPLASSTEAAPGASPADRATATRTVGGAGWASPNHHRSPPTTRRRHTASAIQRPRERGPRAFRSRRSSLRSSDRSTAHSRPGEPFQCATTLPPRPDPAATRTPRPESALARSSAPSGRA